MPQIPTYVSQVGLPSGGMIQLPDEAAGAEGQAMAQAGSRLEDLGLEFSRRINIANQAAQVSALHSQASLDMFNSRQELLASPDYNADPQGATQRWMEQWQNKASDYSSQIDDPRARDLFNNAYNRVFEHQYETLGGEARKRQSQNVTSSTLQSVDNYASMMAKAPTEQEFELYRNNMQMTFDGAVASGAMQPDRAQSLYEQTVKAAAQNNLRNQMQSNPQVVLDTAMAGTGLAKYVDDLQPLRQQAQTLADKQARDGEQASASLGLKWLTGQYGLNGQTPDFASAYADSQDPGKAAAIGITSIDPDRAEELRADIGKVILAGQKRFQQAQKDAQDKIDDDGYNGVMQGKMTGSQVQASNMSPEIKAKSLQFLNTSQKYQDQTDTSTWNAVNQGILDGTITSARDLPGAGQGLSRSDVDKFQKQLETVKDPVNGPWFKMAVENYDKIYKDDMITDSQGNFNPSIMNNSRMAFIQDLTQTIQSQKLTGGVAILKAAQELFDALERTLGIPLRQGNGIVSSHKGADAGERNSDQAE